MSPTTTNPSAVMIALPDEAATLRQAGAYARALGVALHGAATKVYLSGDLGAGKTCFARGFLQALGVTRAVRSPTYALLELYPASELTRAVGVQGVAHLDLYRLAEADELEALGLSDLDQAGWVWLIEWPERAAARLPEADLVVALSVTGESRTLTPSAHSDWGRAWQRAVGRDD